MQHETPPIIVLGGSDSKPSELPEEGRDKHPLVGYKGVEIRLGDRSLIDTVIERLRTCGRFSAIYVAGPARVYGESRGDATVIDTNGSFGENIEAALEHVHRLHPGRAVAFTTCDILPDVETLRRLMDLYAAVAPCDLWYPLIRLPDDRERLGASAWKPAYRIVERSGEPPVSVLPGHLMIVDPAALRLRFVYRLFQIGYRTRNRPIAFRRSVMVRGLIGALLYQDLLHILGLRWPSLTWTVLHAGIPTARDLRDGRATSEQLEDAVRRIFVTTPHRRRYPERRAVLTIADGLSLALDIDTEEEARQMGGDLTAGSTG
jgi:hypothetical protein